MEKFPVRMKDNDLLVTQLFEDPCKDPITALSVYVTPNVCELCMDSVCELCHPNICEFCMDSHRCFVITYLKGITAY